MKKFVYNIIIFICIVAIVISMYNIICWAIENKNNNSVLEEIQSCTISTKEDVTIDDKTIPKLNYDFTELLKKNPQTVGWITVPNTKVDYPVVQTSDNDYYLHHSFDNSSNSAGWVFADSTCDVNNSQNVVIYGHNRKDRSMFGSLKLVLEDDWRANPDNLYISFSSLEETGIYKIFSAFVCNDKDVNSYLSTNFESKDAFNQYVQKLKNSSSYKFDTEIGDSDKMLTLYTCYGLNNQRLLVCAIRVY